MGTNALAPNASDYDNKRKRSGHHFGNAPGLLDLSGIWRNRCAPRRGLQMVMVASLTCRTTAAHQATKRLVLPEALSSR